MSYEFHHGSELLTLCSRYKISIGEVMLRREMEDTTRTREEIFAEMKLNLDVMRTSIRTGLDPTVPTHGLMAGNESVKLARYAQNSELGGRLCGIVAAGMAVAEVNASMGQIVAAPTAGSCGVLPAVLLPLARVGETDEDAICEALYVAAGFGQVIAARATLAGAEGGCQAEVGAASAMAAAALCHLKGGTPEQCAAAAAMALGNLLGLVCDPVAGLVEVPCVKRNVVGAVNAVACANMALAGVDYAIPCDEVIDAMGRVGSLLSPDLRETGQGGLAATPTGVRIAERLAENDG